MVGYTYGMLRWIVVCREIELYVRVQKKYQ